MTCRKVRYRDKIAAMLALASTGRRKTGRQGKDETRFYRCPNCKGWHLTSQRKRR